jgi:hypothetical protein
VQDALEAEVRRLLRLLQLRFGSVSSDTSWQGMLLTAFGVKDNKWGLAQVKADRSQRSAAAEKQPDMIPTLAGVPDRVDSTVFLLHKFVPTIRHEAG